MTERTSTLFIISDEKDNVRLDIFLHTQFPHYSRSLLAKNIVRGNIVVNEEKKKPSYLLKKHDIVSFFLPDEYFLETNPTANPLLAIPILFEDDHILVIDKPAGIQVHPSSTETKNTVVNWLLAIRPDIATVGEDALRPGIVHRLDKDTSGVLVIAKTQKSFEELKKLFASRNIQKRYLAIVFGILQHTSGLIDKPIARSATFRKQVIAEGRTKWKGVPREALTPYVTKETFTKENHSSLYTFSLLDVFPKTGRMHQIRVHLSSIGHPIVGDRLYTRKEYREYPTTSSQLLHAHSISFTLFGKQYSFVSDTPERFRMFITQ